MAFDSGHFKKINQELSHLTHFMDGLDSFINEFDVAYKAALGKIGDVTSSLQEKRQAKIDMQPVRDFLDKFSKILKDYPINIVATIDKFISGWPPLSTKGILWYKTKLFCMGCLAYKEILSEATSKDFPILMNRLESFRMALSAMDCIWEILNADADTIVVSIGSAGTDPQQKCPNFVRQMSEN